MKKFISVEQAVKTSKELKLHGKSVVLVGGVFDLIHVGHIKFLDKSKRAGDILFVLLESDESVRNQKGKNRPLNNQKDRSTVLSAISCVDYIVKLKGIPKNEDYDRIIGKLRPSVLATVLEDTKIEHKIRQAKQVGAKVIKVMSKVKNKSTTQILNRIK